MDKLPLVVEGGQLQQLQPGQTLDLRVISEPELETAQLLRLLVLYLVEQGFADLPAPLLLSLDTLRREAL